MPLFIGEKVLSSHSLQSLTYFQSFDDDAVWAIQEFLQVQFFFVLYTDSNTLKAVINIVVAYIPLYDIEKLFLAYKEILDEENRFYNLNAGLWVVTTTRNSLITLQQQGEVPTGKFATSPVCIF